MLYVQLYTGQHVTDLSPYFIHNVSQHLHTHEYECAVCVCAMLLLSLLSVLLSTEKRSSLHVHCHTCSAQLILIHVELKAALTGPSGSALTCRQVKAQVPLCCPPNRSFCPNTKSFCTVESSGTSSERTCMGLALS